MCVGDECWELSAGDCQVQKKVLFPLELALPVMDAEKCGTHFEV